MISLTHANLIDILDVELLPLEERIELVEQTTDLVEMRTISRIMELFNPTEREAFANMLDAEDDEAITALIDRKGIDIFELALQETDELKKELLRVAEQAKRE